MKFSRLKYYFSVLVTLIKQTSGFRQIMIRNNGLVFKWQTLANLLAIKEVVIDQDYFRLLPEEINPKCVVDIGCGIGDFSIMAAKNWPSSRVFGFEPNNKQFEFANTNLHLNKMSNVRFFNTSVTSIGQLLKESGLKEPIDILKIDCEGAEFEILKDVNPEIVMCLIGEYHEGGAKPQLNLLKH